MRTTILTLCAIAAFAYTLWANNLTKLERDLENLKARVSAIEEQLKDSPDSNTQPNIPDTSPILSELAQQGKVQFESTCTACHKESFSDPMLAPPIAMVKDHYSRVFKDDRAAFVDAVVDWVKAPTQERTLMPGAIRNFNLMPALPLPDSDLKAIATYLFEANLPAPSGFREHIHQERKELQQALH